MHNVCIDKEPVKPMLKRGFGLPSIEAMFSNVDQFIAVLVLAVAITLRHNENVVPIRSGNSPIV